MTTVSGERRLATRAAMASSLGVLVLAVAMALINAETNDAGGGPVARTKHVANPQNGGDGQPVVDGLERGSVRNPQPHREEISSTLLKVVDDETDEPLDVHNHPIYKELKKATFILKEVSVGSSDSTATSLKEVNLRSLHLDKREVSFGDSITLSWQGPINDEDVLAMYCPASETNPRKFRDAATIAQAKATTRKGGRSRHPTSGQKHLGFARTLDGLNVWHIPSFPIVREDSCDFRLMERTLTASGSPTFDVSARTDPLSLSLSRRKPTGVHLALTSDPSEMSVQFTTGDSGVPVVRYGETSHSGSEGLPHKVEGTSTTYGAQDMCQAPANSTDPGRFVSPGMLHMVTLAGLKPNTDYSYEVGIAFGQGIVWGDIQTFRSPLAVGGQEPFSVVVYGDQGVPLDGRDGNGGELTSAMLNHELDTVSDETMRIHAIQHVGGLSYARGVAHIWDDWHSMIEQFASRVPLMVGIGSHEYDHTGGGENGKDPSGVSTPRGFAPEWGNFGSDSGGECGVPTAKRFTMPSNGNGVFWYSYDLGMLHTVMISSEHDLGQGTPQRKWLEKDLNSVNRTATPWLFVELHRPMYNSQVLWEENAVGIGIQNEIEDLLKAYNVDLVLAGRYHTYLRTCDGLYQSRCGNGGPMHITVGTAGASLIHADRYAQNWTEQFKDDWGYGRATFYNSTALKWQFVAALEGGAVKDTVWLVRKRG